MVSVCVGAERDSNPLKVMIVSLQLMRKMKMKNVLRTLCSRYSALYCYSACLAKRPFFARVNFGFSIGFGSGFAVLSNSLFNSIRKRATSFSKSRIFLRFSSIILRVTIFCCSPSLTRRLTSLFRLRIALSAVFTSVRRLAISLFCFSICASLTRKSCSNVAICPR